MGLLYCWLMPIELARLSSIFLSVPAEVIMPACLPACVCAVARGQTSLSQQLQLVERRPIAEQAQKRRSDACYECE